MKRKIKIIIAILLFTSGIILFIYPLYTDNKYKNNVVNKEKEYINNINKIINNDKEIEENKLTELYNLLDSRNKNLYETNEKDFLSKKSYEIDDIDLSNYGLKNNIFGFIEIPKINITLPIYLGASESNMRLGAVHLTGTSYPIGGNNTNSVIAAHRGYYKTKMFRDIDKISLGDILYIKGLDKTLTYRAVNIDIIKPDELDKLTIQENKDMITLISCHPFPYNYQRYIVFFERTD